MKRIIAIILAFIMTLNLVACGGDSEYESPRRNDTRRSDTDESVRGFFGNVDIGISQSSTAKAEIGDITIFGRYEWRVLDIQDGKALIITERVINNMPYHRGIWADFSRQETYEITWANCDLRTYLNNEFYHSFSAQDRNHIVQVTNKNSDNPWYNTPGGGDTQDYIFLLSIDEVLKYFGDSGQLDTRKDNQSAIDDDYNEARRAVHIGGTRNNYVVDSSNHFVMTNETINIPEGEKQYWWLRSPGENSTRVADIEDNGCLRVRGNTATSATTGVRPALWLDIIPDRHSSPPKETEDYTAFYTTGNEVVTDKIITVSNNPVFYLRNLLNASVFEYEGLYTGEWKDDKPNGYGVFTATKRFISGGNTDDYFLFEYKGEWVDGEITGVGHLVSYYQDTKSIDWVIEGRFENGILDGVTIITLNPEERPTVVFAEYDSGVAVGEGLISNNEYTTLGIYENGVLAEGTRIYADGSVYQGELGTAEGLRLDSTAYNGKLTFADRSFYIEGGWTRIPSLRDIELAKEYENEVRATAFTRMMSGPIKIQFSTGLVFEGNAATHRGILRAPDGTSVEIVIDEDTAEFRADDSDLYHALALITTVGFFAGWATIIINASDPSSIWYDPLPDIFLAEARANADATRAALREKEATRRATCATCNRQNRSCICNHRRNNYTNKCRRCDRFVNNCRCSY